MGNLCGSCFNTWKEGGTAPNTYFREEHENDSLTIEFENLVDDGESGSTNPPFITDTERQYLISRNYESLVEDQRKLDDEIDAELIQQEEDLKIEEEAYIAAKKESARVARQKRLEEERKRANGHANSWIGGNESEWDVAGGEDDFETFLESVKARSLNSQSNSMDVNNPLEYYDKELTEAEIMVTSGKRGETNAGLDSDIDWEWDQDYTGAGDPADAVANGTGTPVRAPVTAGKNTVHSGNPNEIVTEVQIETVDKDLTFDDDFDAAPKVGSTELLAESEADR